MMFRITQHLCKHRTLLQRSNPAKFKLAALCRSPPNLQYKKVGESPRETCPPPIPPCPPPTDDRIFWGIVGILAFMGGYAVYAHGSKETRDWITLNAPWYDDLIAVLYQENLTYGEMADYCAVQLSKYVSKKFSPKPKDCSNVIEVPAEPEVIPPTEEGKEPCVVLPPPVLTKDICELEKCLRDLGQDALNNYFTADAACAYYNKLVADLMGDFSFNNMKEMRSAMVERKGLEEKHVKDAETAEVTLADLNRYLDCGVRATPEKIEATKLILQDYQHKIKLSRRDYDEKNRIAEAKDEQLQMVEKIVYKYTQEVENMYADVCYQNKKSELKGDPEMFLLHARRYFLFLEANLKTPIERLVAKTSRIVAGLGGTEDEIKKRCDYLEKAPAKKRGEMDKEYSDRLKKLKQKNDVDFKNEIRKQTEELENCTDITIKYKEEEVIKRFNVLVDKNVKQEKKAMAEELKKMQDKLKELEEKLEVRIRLEKEIKDVRSLWEAASSLNAATRKGDPIIPVCKEIKTIETLYGKDKLVTTILKSLPASVREKGVVPECILRDNYRSMESVALKVALVDQDGAPMPVYVLSWLQSVLLFMKFSTLPQAEIDNRLQEPFQHLDTFDLMQRARFYVDHGDYAEALRYINALEGASKAAAASWSQATRDLLVTRQASEAVMAHATALGLKYV